MVERILDFSEQWVQGNMEKYFYINDVNIDIMSILASKKNKHCWHYSASTAMV